MAVGDSNLAGVARVAFEAQTGEFNRDVSVAERTYKSATDGMSDAAIRLELANERLRRSLAKGPNAAREQARALLSVRQAERDLTQETDRNTRSQERNQRELKQTARGALAGSGAFRGLGRSIAFASGSFLGTAGLVYGIKSALNASSNLNEQTSKTRVVFGGASREVIAFSRDALGLARDQALETAGSIGALLRPMGIVEERSAKIAVGLTKLGTDLSSFYNTSVQDALDAIRSGLVGEVEPLRRYGVIVSATKVEQLAMAQSGKTNAKALTDEEKALARVAIILRDTKLAHGDYARTIAGSANQEREMQKNWRNTQILLGQTLQPTYNDLLRTVNKWLGQAENQKRLQHDVNAVVHTGVEVFRGIAGAMEDASKVVKPLVNGLGGIENTLKLIAGVWVAFKAKSVLGFAATAVSSRTTSVRMIADAAAAGRAWDIATRPRVLTVAERIAPYGGGGGVPAPAPSKGGRFPRIPFVPGFNGPTAVAAAVLISGGSQGFRDEYDPKRYPRIASAIAYAEKNGAYPPGFLDALSTLGNVNGKSIRDLTSAQLQKLEANLAPQRVGVEGGDRDRPNMGRAVDRPPRRPRSTRSRGGAGGRRGNGLSRLDTLELAAQRAELTPYLSDDLRISRQIEDVYRRRAQQEGLRGEKLKEAQSAWITAQQRTQAIEDQIAENERQVHEKAAAKRKANAAKITAARKRAKAETDRMVKAATDALPGVGISPYAQTSSGFAKGGISAAAAARKTAAAKKEPDGMSAQDVGNLLRDFMQWQIGLAREGSNVAGGNLGTYVLEQLTRETNGHLSRIATPRGPRRDLDEAVMAW